MELKNIIRAVIQSSSHPVSVESLCRVFQKDKVAIEKAIEGLLKEPDPVQALRKVAGGYRYYIHAHYAPWLRKAEDKTESLSKALLETLAIIAYQQPISKSEVDFIRGKSSAQALFEQLEQRHWIRELGQAEGSTLYGTTLEFLEYFGLTSLEELPQIEEQGLLEKKTFLGEVND